MTRATTTTNVELDGQYRLLREEAGLVDRSERGKLVLRGADTAEYLQGQLTNDVEALEPGEGQYAALLDRKGRMQGDLRLLRLDADRFWIDTETIALPAIARHLGMYKIGREVELEDETEAWAILSVIGPGTEAAVGTAIGPEHSHEEAALGGSRVRAVATDSGADLLVPAADAAAVREALGAAGVAETAPEAAEILRVESGRPRFGAEMTTETIPQEAGLNERAVSFTKGCYIGQETVARLHYKGKPNRHLRGLRLSAPAEAGDPVRLGERELGRIGTAVLSPARGAIALAILRREAEPGATVEVGADGNEAEVVEVPFE
ncbi:MAG TPA: glycine cleavage T C-terminal barrel domain-containing protein [Solirubrobacterales bacterium]